MSLLISTSFTVFSFILFAYSEDYRQLVRSQKYISQQEDELEISSSRLPGFSVIHVNGVNVSLLPLSPCVPNYKNKN